ncbi:27 kDa glycoprotein-like [Anopheles albimanus]|uniref:27 kDa glycoprotein-like n=1 Tax=Anopheles albimanus TaxID=7167 RepID=UPI00164029E0|nr:27 kDa glycoprotein-like [Anopheles albimanus]XP_035788748.1 27 kDa glycoprotein-like [Anopheles albimanus]
MSKLSVKSLFIGLSLLIVCAGSPLSHESSESNESVEPNKLDFFQKLREQCRNNTGSDDAFLVLMESFENVSRCVLKFDVEGFKNDFDQLTNATRTAFFTKYCSEARPLVSCFDGVLVSSRPCVKESGFKVIQAFYDSIPKTLDLVCKNDGEIIFKMKDETRKKCFAQEGKQISVCVNTYARSAIWNDDWNYELTQDKCSTLTSYRQCLMEPLDACDLSDLISIYDVPMNAMLSLTPCGNNKEELKVETHQNNSTDEI